MLLRYTARQEDTMRTLFIIALAMLFLTS